MRTASGFRVACLALELVLIGASCTGPPRDAGEHGVRGGTLRVLSHESLVGLDTAGYTGCRARSPGPCTATTSPGRPSR